MEDQELRLPPSPAEWEAMKAENAKLRAEVEELRKSADFWRDDSVKHGELLGAALLQVGAWDKLVRTTADRLYAFGKALRKSNRDEWSELMAFASDLHREVGIIKGEEPLPAAGERLTEKRIDETVYCTCFPSIPCRVPGHV